MAQYSKTGQGAFQLEISETDGTVRAQRDGCNEHRFTSPSDAYDFYRPLADSGDHAAWNLCYHLEDHLHDVKGA